MILEIIYFQQFKFKLHHSYITIKFIYPRNPFLNPLGTICC
jgi:hypothetical protein